MRKLLARYHININNLTLLTLLLITIYVTNSYNYLLFHSFAELFSIIIAACIFVLAWNARISNQSSYMLYIGIASLFIGTLDLLHMLAYKGMGIFHGYDANLPTQLWIAARYTQALVFLSALLFVKVRPRPYVTLGGFTLFILLLFHSIFVKNIFPTCYIEDVGLTPFKIASEYTIIGLFMLSLLLLYRHRERFDRGVFILLNLSIGFLVCAELAFTSYIGVYDTANMLGHILKIVSFYFLYRAIVVTGITKPFDLIFRDLQQSRLKVQQYSSDLEGKVRERTAQLTKMNNQLHEEIIMRKKAVARTKRRFAQLQALRAIDVAIIEGYDLHVTLDVVLNQVIKKLHVDAAAILLLNEQTQKLEYSAARGFRTTIIENSIHTAGHGTTSTCVRDQEIAKIPRLHNTTGFERKGLIEAEGFASYYGVPLVAKGQREGILDIFTREEYHAKREWLTFLETLAGQAAIAINNAIMFNELEVSRNNLISAYEATMEGWVKALDLRDNETESHTQRVTRTSVQLARALGVAEEEIVHLRRGALLHDIGKIGVPDTILNKPAKLTEGEWKVMRQHPVHAYNMLSSITYLQDAIDIPYCHHEKWDSSGYPRGLQGEEIPLAARIFAIVDVWDALSSDRPYRSAMDEEEILRYLNEHAGTHFDPEITSVFLQLRADALSLPSRNSPLSQ